MNGTLARKGASKCKVCNDKAVGYNFNGLTCESCKIFFRRHANKLEIFKCNSRVCQITATTRNCCRRCRLEKCYAIGMKKELIDYKYTKQNKENPASFKAFASPANIPIENCSSIVSCLLPSLELSRLQELQSAMASTFLDERTLPIARVASDLTEAMNSHSYYVRNTIKFCKSLEGFKALNAQDQLAILKGFNMEIGCIRAAFVFNVPMDGMIVMHRDGDNDSTVFIELNVFKTEKNAMPQYRHFLTEMQKEMENDTAIRDLVIAKQLYSLRDGVTSTEFIRYHHQLYVNLLKLYLEAKYQDAEKASFKFSVLVNLLSQFDNMRIIKRQMVGELNADELNQETIELFDYFLIKA